MKAPVQETTYTWQQLTQRQKELVMETHAKAFKSYHKAISRRSFALGKPKIVAANDWSHCRIDEGSVQEMREIFSTLLKKKKFPRRHFT